LVIHQKAFSEERALQQLIASFNNYKNVFKFI
jgi:hypothetical protein